MPYRIDLPLRAERTPEIGQRGREAEKRVAYLLLARCIPARWLELAGAAVLLDLDGVLKSVHLLQVIRPGGIDKRTKRVTM